MDGKLERAVFALDQSAPERGAADLNGTITIVDETGQPVDIGGGGGEPVAVSWDDIEGKPAVIAAGGDQAAARSAIGAGTSSIAIGTTATTAAAGNHTHAASAVTATAISPGTATNVQGILAELAARISALESAG